VARGAPDQLIFQFERAEFGHMVEIGRIHRRFYESGLPISQASAPITLSWINALRSHSAILTS
jgi:hypothetical protein